MSTDYVGEAYIEIDGKEYDVIRITVQHNTGRKPVPTMNRKRRVKGTCAGIETWELSVTAAIPEGEKEPWKNFKDAKLTVTSGDGGKRVSYLDCFSREISKQYEVEGEARVDITMTALDCVEE